MEEDVHRSSFNDGGLWDLSSQQGQMSSLPLHQNFVSDGRPHFFPQNMNTFLNYPQESTRHRQPHPQLGGNEQLNCPPEWPMFAARPNPQDPHFPYPKLGPPFPQVAPHLQTAGQVIDDRIPQMPMPPSGPFTTYGQSLDSYGNTRNQDFHQHLLQPGSSACNPSGLDGNARPINADPVKDTPRRIGSKNPTQMKSQEPEQKNSDDKIGRTRNEEDWMKNRKKNARGKGESYVSASGEIVPARSVKPVDCSKCKFDCKSHVSEEERRTLFDTYWGLGTFEDKVNFICDNVEEFVPLRPASGRRSFSRRYGLNVSGKSVRVCKEFFLSTFDISESMVQTCLDKMRNDPKAIQDMRGKKTPPNKTSEESLYHAREHILSQLSLQRSLDQPPDEASNIKCLYAMYQAECDQDGQKPLSFSAYRTVYSDLHSCKDEKQIVLSAGASDVLHQASTDSSCDSTLMSCYQGRSLSTSSSSSSVADNDVGDVSGSAKTSNESTLLSTSTLEHQSQPTQATVSSSFEYNNSGGMGGFDQNRSNNMQYSSGRISTLPVSQTHNFDPWHWNRSHNESYTRFLHKASPYDVSGGDPLSSSSLHTPNPNNVVKDFSISKAVNSTDMSCRQVASSNFHEQQETFTYQQQQTACQSSLPLCNVRDQANQLQRSNIHGPPVLDVGACSVNSTDSVSTKARRKNPMPKKRDEPEKKNPEAKTNRSSNEESWMKNRKKAARAKGESYVSASGKIVPARYVKPASCSKCRFNCKSHISEEDRQAIFSTYWGLDAFKDKVNFICDKVEEFVPLRPINRNSRKRAYSRRYRLKVNGKDVRVCKEFFLSTFDISESVVDTYLLKVRNNPGAIQDMRGKNKRLNQTLATSLSLAREHILSQIGLHKTIDSATSLYALYENECKQNGQRPVCSSSYRRLYRDLQDGKCQRSFPAATDALDIPDNATTSLAVSNHDSKTLVTKTSNSETGCESHSFPTSAHKLDSQPSQRTIGSSFDEFDNNDEMDCDRNLATNTDGQSSSLGPSLAPISVSQTTYCSPIDGNESYLKSLADNTHLGPLNETSGNNLMGFSTYGVVNSTNVPNQFVTSDLHAENSTSCVQSNVKGESLMPKKRKESKDKNSEATRKTSANQESWMKNRKKAARSKGESYVSASGKIVPARSIKPVSCSKCRFNCKSHISEEDRQTIFSTYWGLDAFKDKVNLICDNVQEFVPLRPRNKNSRKRSFSRRYRLKVNGKNARVCKEFFLSTFDISESVVDTYLLKMRNNPGAIQDMRGKKKRLNQALATSLSLAREHILSQIGLHKTNDSGTVTATGLYALYQKECKQNGQKNVCSSSYRRLYRDLLQGKSKRSFPVATDALDIPDNATTSSGIQLMDLSTSKHQFVTSHLHADNASSSCEQSDVREKNPIPKNFETKSRTTGNEEAWMKNRKKAARAKGDSYVSASGKIVPARSVKAVSCSNCRFGCKTRVSEEDRQTLFSTYWGLEEFKDKVNLICDNVEEFVPLRPFSGKKSFSRRYRLKVNGKEERVCKEFFLSTFDIGEKFVDNCLRKKRGNPEAFENPGGAVTLDQKPASSSTHLGIYSDLYHGEEEFSSAESDQSAGNLLDFSSHVADCGTDRGSSSGATNTKTDCESLSHPALAKGLHSADSHPTQSVRNSSLDLVNENRQIDSINQTFSTTSKMMRKETTPKTSNEPESLMCVEDKNLKKKLRTSEDALIEILRRNARERGESYMTATGKIVPAKSVKPAFCSKCRFNCKSQISEDERQRIFSIYWGLESFKDKVNLIYENVEELLSRRPVSGKRSFTRRYMIKINGKEVRVCKEFFLSTFDISESVVDTCLRKKRTNPRAIVDMRGKKVRFQKNLHHIQEHVLSLSQQDLLGNLDKPLQETVPVTYLYSLYKTECEHIGRKPASYATYRRTYLNLQRDYKDEMSLSSSYGGDSDVHHEATTASATNSNDNSAPLSFASSLSSSLIDRAGEGAYSGTGRPTTKTEYDSFSLPTSVHEFYSQRAQAAINSSFGEYGNSHQIYSNKNGANGIEGGQSSTSGRPTSLLPGSDSQMSHWDPNDWNENDFRLFAHNTQQDSLFERPGSHLHNFKTPAAVNSRNSLNSKFVTSSLHAGNDFAYGEPSQADRQSQSQSSHLLYSYSRGNELNWQQRRSVGGPLILDAWSCSVNPANRLPSKGKRKRPRPKKRSASNEKDLEAKTNKARNDEGSIANRWRRARGESYVLASGRVVPAKSVKPASCSKCRFNCQFFVSEEERQKAFSTYWGLEAFKDKVALICDAVEELLPLRPVSGKRAFTRRYMIKVNGKEVRVCKEFFLSTFDISESVVDTCLRKKRTSPGAIQDMRGKNKNSRLNKNLHHIQGHILSQTQTDLLVGDLHHKSPQETLSITCLYSLYKAECVQIDRKPASYATYRRIYLDMQRDFNDERSLFPPDGTSDTVHEASMVGWTKSHPHSALPSTSQGNLMMMSSPSSSVSDYDALSVTIKTDCESHSFPSSSFHELHPHPLPLQETTGSSLVEYDNRDKIDSNSNQNTWNNADGQSESLRTPIMPGSLSQTYDRDNRFYNEDHYNNHQKSLYDDISRGIQLSSYPVIGLQNLLPHQSFASNVYAEKPCTSEPSHSYSWCQESSSTHGKTKISSSTNVSAGSERPYIGSPRPLQSSKKKRKQNEASAPQLSNVCKRLRTKLETYVSLSLRNKKVQVKAKKPIAIDCSKCRFNCQSKVSEKRREEINAMYWDLDTYRERISFIAKLVKVFQPIRRKNGGSRRAYSRKYTFDVDQEEHQVCKDFFQATLNVGERLITNALKKSRMGPEAAADLRGRRTPANKTSQQTVHNICQLVTYVTGLRPDQDWSDGKAHKIPQLYQAYKYDCEVKGQSAAGIGVFRTILLKEFGISAFGKTSKEKEK